MSPSVKNIPKSSFPFAYSNNSAQYYTPFFDKLQGFFTQNTQYLDNTPFFY